MVYHIRNKGYWSYFEKANSSRVFNARKTKIDIDITRYTTFQSHITRYSGQRIKHNYRRISRAMKQFMMGD